MFLLRTSRHTPPAFLSRSSAAAPAVTISKRFSSSDYGSGQHNNEPNSSVHKEHPGPPPPKAAQSNSSHKGDSSDSSSSSSSSSSKSAGGSQPKILNESPPKEGQEPADVRKHNEEMQKRADRPHESVKDKDIEKDKVNKGFWSVNLLSLNPSNTFVKVKVGEIRILRWWTDGRGELVRDL